MKLSILSTALLLSIPSCGQAPEEGAPSPLDPPGSVVLASDRGGTWDLYQVSRESGRATALTSEPHDEVRPEVSPEGDRIVFEEQTESGSFIATLSLLAREPLPVRLTETGLDSEPSWSPDGERIVFVSGRDGDVALFVMSADGSGVQRLSPANAANRTPRWSPSGEKILYTSIREPRARLCVMNAVGSASAPLTQGSDDCTLGSWSPDGLWIAFTLTTARSAQSIALMRADGTERRRLIGNQEPEDRNISSWGPRFSANGRHIVFSSLQEGGQVQVYETDLEGSEVRRLPSGTSQSREADYLEPSR